MPSEDSITPSLEELQWQRFALERCVSELQSAVVTKSEEVDKLKQQVDCRLINVATIGGDVIQCSMPEDSAVQDLLDAAMVEDNSDVHKAHAALLRFDLLTESGHVMEKDKKICDYNLSSDSILTLVKRRLIDGSYTCWVQIDYNLVTHSEKFTLLINDKRVSINDVGGVLEGDAGKGERVSVAFSSPIRISSSVPHSRAFFQVTGCEFECRIGNYSSASWFPVEGRLLGTGSHGVSAVAFKGRFRERSCN
eukprot:TRINITY_DN48235_c0_g1_i1.p1 TRINITY_DN48235_c0_g1~~TRINITY_DN48235_c0_g1_i1.p1  ORF type:complete len:283 (-),score=56.34 TRINITY_DN48235_c0_g1_i1:120-872(-)